MAEYLVRGMDADPLVVQLAALLHDIADWKLHDGDKTVGPRIARSLLGKYGLPDETIDAVCTIIPEISFKGAGVSDEPSTLESKIVQDADRLDAIGAIGIARAFAYGGHVGQELYDPDRAPVMHTSKEAYISRRNSTINHFYEKLLLVKIASILRGPGRSLSNGTILWRPISTGSLQNGRIPINRFYRE